MTKARWRIRRANPNEQKEFKCRCGKVLGTIDDEGKLWLKMNNEEGYITAGYVPCSCGKGRVYRRPRGH